MNCSCHGWRVNSVSGDAHLGGGGATSNFKACAIDGTLARSPSTNSRAVSSIEDAVARAISSVLDLTPPLDFSSRPTKFSSPSVTPVHPFLWNELASKLGTVPCQKCRRPQYLKPFELCDHRLRCT